MCKILFHIIALVCMLISPSSAFSQADGSDVKLYGSAGSQTPAVSADKYIYLKSCGFPSETSDFTLNLDACASFGSSNSIEKYYYAKQKKGYVKFKSEQPPADVKEMKIHVKYFDIPKVIESYVIRNPSNISSAKNSCQRNLSETKHPLSLLSIHSLRTATSITDFKLDLRLCKNAKNIKTTELMREIEKFSTTGSDDAINLGNQLARIASSHTANFYFQPNSPHLLLLVVRKEGCISDEINKYLSDRGAVPKNTANYKLCAENEKNTPTTSDYMELDEQKNQELQSVDQNIIKFNAPVDIRITGDVYKGDALCTFSITEKNAGETKIESNTLPVIVGPGEQNNSSLPPGCSAPPPLTIAFTDEIGQSYDFDGQPVFAELRIKDEEGQTISFKIFNLNQNSEIQIDDSQFLDQVYTSSKHNNVNSIEITILSENPKLPGPMNYKNWGVRNSQASDDITGGPVKWMVVVERRRVALDKLEFSYDDKSAAYFQTCQYDLVTADDSFPVYSFGGDNVLAFSPGGDTTQLDPSVYLEPTAAFADSFYLKLRENTNLASEGCKAEISFYTPNLIRKLNDNDVQKTLVVMLEEQSFLRPDLIIVATFDKKSSDGDEAFEADSRNYFIKHNLELVEEFNRLKTSTGLRRWRSVFFMQLNSTDISQREVSHRGDQQQDILLNAEHIDQFIRNSGDTNTLNVDQIINAVLERVKGYNLSKGLSNTSASIAIVGPVASANHENCLPGNVIDNVGVFVFNYVSNRMEATGGIAESQLPADCLHSGVYSTAINKVVKYRQILTPYQRLFDPNITAFSRDEGLNSLMEKFKDINAFSLQ